jgi:hypothetical protein
VHFDTLAGRGSVGQLSRLLQRTDRALSDQSNPTLHEPDPDRAYWRSRTPAERLAHLESFGASTTGGLMELNRDFSEFIASCVAHDVRFMIVGRYPVDARRA